jgi:hypothetical protein
MSEETPEFYKVEKENLDFKDPPTLMWIPVQRAVQLLWSENPKLHDVGLLVQSIEKHGFQELPRYDINLPNVSGGMGAIKAGNGRIETLAAMERDAMSLPRGLAQEKESKAWVMPILMGTDVDSVNAARAYAIDSNNLTMSGGDYSLLDILKLWKSDDYIKLLNDLAQDDSLPVTIDGDAMDWLNSLNTYDQSGEELGEELERESTLAYKVIVGNLLLLQDVGKVLGDLAKDNPDWKLKIELMT